MRFQHGVLLLVCHLASFKLTNATPIKQQENVLTECGQTLRANSGVIEYKLNQTYDAGELCVFILRNNFTVRPYFRFVLESHGFNTADPDAIEITTVGERNGYLETDYSELGPPEPIGVDKVFGNVATVVFRTYSASGTGFRLSFKASGDPEHISGLNEGQNFVFNNPMQSPFTPPLETECKQKGCLDVIVLTAAAKKVTDPQLLFRINVAANLSVPCESASFEVDSYAGKGDSGRVCGTNSTTFSGRGMFLIYFFRSMQTPATGTITWELALDPEN